MFNVIKRIFDLRDNRNMTTNEFAKFANVSQSYLSQLEGSKRKRVSINFVEKICQACNISLSEFFEGTDNPVNIKVAMSSKDKVDLLERIEKLKAEIKKIENKIK